MQSSLSLELFTTRMVVFLTKMCCNIFYQFALIFFVIYAFKNYESMIFKNFFVIILWTNDIISFNFDFVAINKQQQLAAKTENTFDTV